MSDLRFSRLLKESRLAGLPVIRDLSHGGDLACAGGTIGRRGCSRMCRWRSAFRRITRYGRSGSCGSAFGGAERAFRGVVFVDGPALDPARDAAAGDAAACRWMARPARGELAGCPNN